MKDVETIKKAVNGYGLHLMDWSEMSETSIRRSLVNGFKFLKDDDDISKEDLIFYANSPDVPLNKLMRESFNDALNHWNGEGWED